jgi:pantoate--beta-alanine ligase
MEIVRTKSMLREAIRRQRALGKAIGLVPTMGALHDGHVSLVTLAKQHAQAVVASIFVNPTQFGPNEDFSRYPRSEADDVARLEAAGAEIAYIPGVEEIYPPGFNTRIEVPGISDELCGAFRPGHFSGVATVVTKLFQQVTPDVAVFGEKDYQQLHIIRQTVRDLDMTVRIIGAPILREPDGLAMSSRNRYLSGLERPIAAALYRLLNDAVGKMRAGDAVDKVLAATLQALLDAGFSKVDYVELRDSATLRPVNMIAQPARLLAAAHLGKTRLIDNIVVE